MTFTQYLEKIEQHIECNHIGYDDCELLKKYVDFYEDTSLSSLLRADPVLDLAHECKVAGVSTEDAAYRIFAVIDQHVGLQEFAEEELE